MTLPLKYEEMPEEEILEGIRQAKRALGESLTILGHHYQRDEVIQFADFRGDSLGLSRQAAQSDEAEFIVFCGVSFMAETAAILCKPGQVVIQPVAEAICPMARMASAGELSQAWAALTSVWGDDLVPITYQNSTAAAKAFVGQQGGAVCTSSNSRQLFEWALRDKTHILFTPDEHLGVNTAMSMGIPRQKIGIWDRASVPDPHSLAGCSLVAWKGFCYVHTGFTGEDVDAARRRYPDALVVVHPECPREIVAKADASGSTSGIIKFVEEAPSGSTIVVGTEWHLVNRLHQEHGDKRIVPLRRRVCATMAMTRMKHLLYVLDAILGGRPCNVVTVDEEISEWARVALDRMLQAS